MLRSAEPTAGTDLRVTEPEALARHEGGDWGEVPSEDAYENERGLKHGWRVFNSYPVGDAGEKVWVITETDRSPVCTLLPEDYRSCT